MTTDFEQLKKLQPSIKYLARNYEDLLKKYPDSYVAIVNEEVVFSDGDFKTILQKVKERYGSTRSVLIEYLTTKYSQLIV